MADVSEGCGLQQQYYSWSDSHNTSNICNDSYSTKHHTVPNNEHGIEQNIN
jgi:hypothetical protein